MRGLSVALTKIVISYASEPCTFRIEVHKLGSYKCEGNYRSLLYSLSWT